MRCLLACSLLLFSSSAFAGSKLDPVGAAEEKPLKGNVLVWHDATLLSEPSETARTLQLATFDVPRKDRVGHVVAMKVVAGKGAFVEVELAGDEDCTWSRVVVPDDLARVRMFVRRTDIAPALVKPFTKTFADGTQITLAVGTRKGEGLMRRLEVSRDPVVMLNAALQEAAKAAGVELKITESEILLAT